MWTRTSASSHMSESSLNDSIRFSNDIILMTRTSDNLHFLVHRARNVSHSIPTFLLPIHSVSFFGGNQRTNQKSYSNHFMVSITNTQHSPSVTFLMHNRESPRIHFDKHETSQPTSDRSEKHLLLPWYAFVGLGVVISPILSSIHTAYDAGQITVVSSKTLLVFVLVLIGMHPKCIGTTWRQLQNSSKKLKSAYLASPLSPKSLQKSLSSTEALSRLSRVSSAHTIRRLSTTIQKTFSSYRKRVAIKAITRNECFAKRDRIERLSISDLITLFRYAVDVSQVDFDKKRFMNAQSILIRSIVTAMDMAVSVSRGGRAVNVKFSGEKKGEVDALYFAAVVRIFAEWRAIRLVPEGYKRYTVGLNLAYRDILQNLSKIECGVHEYLRHQASAKEGQDPIACPSLRQVLQFERDTNLHPKLPRLAENSVASGILWSKRQLHYQLSLLANSLEVPVHFETAQAAAQAAYTEVYDEYHGWAVKQIFSNSFGGSPPLEKIWNQMIPPDEVGVGDMAEKRPSLRPLSSSESGELVDNEFLAALEEFGNFVTQRWEDFNRLLHCLEDDKNKKRSQNLIISHESYLNMNGFQLPPDPPSDDDLPSSSPADQLEEIKRNTSVFVKEVRPLLSDIGEMIAELNMNDPSRV